VQRKRNKQLLKYERSYSMKSSNLFHSFHKWRKSKSKWMRLEFSGGYEFKILFKEDAFEGNPF